MQMPCCQYFRRRLRAERIRCYVRISKSCHKHRPIGDELLYFLGKFLRHRFIFIGISAQIVIFKRDIPPLALSYGIFTAVIVNDYLGYSEPLSPLAHMNCLRQCAYIHAFHCKIGAYRHFQSTPLFKFITSFSIIVHNA